MINTFQIARLPNPVYVQFMDYVVTAVQDKNPLALNVKAKYDVLSQKLTELKNIYKSAKASTLTEKIINADHLRDQILTGIIKIVDGNTYHFSENMGASASLLQKNILNYGSNIIRNDFQTETANIESLVADWRTKTDLVNAMNSLQLDIWIDELEDANNEFKILYAKRTDEYSQLPDENMESKRKEVNAAYDDLCRHLNSYSVTNSNQDYDSLIAEINSYVEQFSKMIKQRKSRAKKPDSAENQTVE